MVLESPRRLVERELEVPAIGADDGLLRIEACGLCGTDHEQWSGDLPTGFAFVPGHESVGIIEEIGQVASERWGVQRGDRVAVEVFLSCRQCDRCAAGEYRRCRAHGIAGMYGFMSIDNPPGLWGGYATHQYLAPDSMLLPVPVGLDPIVATLFNPLGAGIRWGVTVPGTKAGDVVAVLGPGIRGLSALVAAREAGAGFVMVTGFGERDAPRLEVARQFGADLTVDVAVEDPVRALRAAAGRSADVVVDVTAKAPAALAQAVALARAGGSVVLAGTRGSPETPGFHPDHVVYKELRILGALGVDAPAYAAALDLLASGKYPFASLPRAVVPLSQADDLLRTMAGESGEPPLTPCSCQAPPIRCEFGALGATNRRTIGGSAPSCGGGWRSARPPRPRRRSTRTSRGTRPCARSSRAWRERRRRRRRRPR
jgi:alcohol dehydrogenase